MARRVIVARGGALSQRSGLGRVHHDLTNRLGAGLIDGFILGGELEYASGGGIWKRYHQRRFKHPRHVSKTVEEEHKKFKDSILHITDQEQAHLVPRNALLPVSVTIHDLFHIEPRKIGTTTIGEQNPNYFRRADLQRIRDGISRANLLICISEATAAECRTLWPDKEIVVVHHGINVDEFNPDSNRLKPPPELSTSDVNLLFVGSEDPRKRLGFLLDVIGSIPPKFRDRIKLHKIGAESNPTIRRSIEVSAEQKSIRLNWVGSIDDVALKAWYQNADALLFPSVAEGFGVPPLEAMASGCPVRIADMPAHNEVSPDMCKLPADDVDAWIDSILKIIETRDSTNSIHEPDVMSLEHARKFNTSQWCSQMKSAWETIPE